MSSSKLQKINSYSRPSHGQPLGRNSRGNRNILGIHDANRYALHQRQRHGRENQKARQIALHKALETRNQDFDIPCRDPWRRYKQIGAEFAIHSLRGSRINNYGACADQLWGSPRGRRIADVLKPSDLISKGPHPFPTHPSHNPYPPAARYKIQRPTSLLLLWITYTSSACASSHHDPLHLASQPLDLQSDGLEPLLLF